MVGARSEVVRADAEIAQLATPRLGGVDARADQADALLEAAIGEVLDEAVEDLLIPNAQSRPGASGPGSRTSRAHPYSPAAGSRPSSVLAARFTWSEHASVGVRRTVDRAIGRRGLNKKTNVAERSVTRSGV
jgi:hypothetical protein